MSFDVAPAAYEAFMGRWSRRLAPAFVAFADPTRNARVLDVGCGTGAVLEQLSPPWPAHQLTAVDPSSSFLAAVHERLPEALTVQAQAERLPLADSSHGTALAQLVVHFMAHPALGLAEMRRVTEPGGVVAACVWDFGGGRGPLGVFWEAARAVDPASPGEAHLPGTREGELAGLLRDAGMTEIRTVALEVRIEHPTFEAWWQPFTRGAGPAGAHLAGLSSVQRQRVLEACRERLPDGPILVTAAAWAARGVA